MRARFRDRFHCIGENIRNCTVGSHLANHLGSKKEGKNWDIRHLDLRIPFESLTPVKPEAKFIYRFSQISPFCLSQFKLDSHYQLLVILNFMSYKVI